jgi:hypothetical protein
LHAFVSSFMQQKNTITSIFTFALLSLATDQGLSIVFLSKYTTIDSKKRWSGYKAQGLDEYCLALPTVY